MNRLETVEVDGVIEQEYSYDSLSRLELAKDHNGSRKTNVVEYEYDSLNNISKSTQNGKVVDSVYNLNSKLESIEAQSYKVVNTYTTRDSLDKITLNENEIVDFNKDNRKENIQKMDKQYILKQHSMIQTQMS